MEEEKVCTGSKYFMRHYVKTGNGTVETSCGHCLKIQNQSFFKIRDFNKFGCEEWQAAEDITVDRKIEFAYQMQLLVSKMDIINSLLDDLYCEK